MRMIDPYASGTLTSLFEVLRIKMSLKIKDYMGRKHFPKRSPEPNKKIRLMFISDGIPVMVGYGKARDFRAMVQDFRYRDPRAYDPYHYSFECFMGAFFGTELIALYRLDFTQYTRLLQKGYFGRVGFHRFMFDVKKPSRIMATSLNNLSHLEGRQTKGPGRA
jgi:hypothetical protein